MTTQHKLPQALDGARDDLWARQRQLLTGLLAELEGGAHPLNRALAEEVDQGGKRVRASLPLLCAHALARDPGDDGAALWLGLAVELIHVATLCHDDVMDGDRVRRNRATAWCRLGAAQAITLRHASPPQVGPLLPGPVAQRRPHPALAPAPGHDHVIALAGARDAQLRP
jgi:geranylgeranyl diphosphate synthase type I